MSGFGSAFGVMRPPGSVIFGEGMLGALPDAVGRLGTKILVCGDPVLLDNRTVQDVIARIRAAGLSVVIFQEITPELPKSCVQACLDALDGFCPDLVVGLGGGSAIDLAKLVALALSWGSDLDQFYGENRVPGPVKPVIAVPTTAGTGSEVTPVAVLNDEARSLKVGISSRYLVPEVAIVDPCLTYSCPPGLSVASGADALTHAIEALTTLQRAPDPCIEAARVFVGKNILSDLYAREAIRLIAPALKAVAQDGQNTGARRDMMLGSLLAGMAFSVAGTAAAHAIQYPVGALTKTAHGLGVATLIPYVMAFNAPTCMTTFAQIATAMGQAQGTEAERAAAAPRLVRDLLADVGIPRTLRDLGVADQDKAWIVEQSLNMTRLVENNPRELNAAGVEAIIDCAMDGLF